MKEGGRPTDEVVAMEWTLAMNTILPYFAACLTTFNQSTRNSRKQKKKNSRKGERKR
jgi:hypothetical protein